MYTVKCSCDLVYVIVPLSPDGVSCGELTDSSVQVMISPPNASLSPFNIDWYQVIYRPVTGSNQQMVTHDVAYTDDSQAADDTLTNATAGVTYSVLVMSRSGHLMSQSVSTGCTAGRFTLSLQWTDG